jgi:DNA-binding LacI/PurR family transcriptional regulator
MQISSRTSIRQVAERAAVSRMTVSNVIHGRSGKVSPETFERVLQAIRELEYAPVPQPARQSRHVETRIIGLIFDSIEPEDYWGAMTFRGLRDAAKCHGYDLLTILRAPERWMLDREELNFLDRRSDGFIFIVPKDRYGVMETLVNHGISSVACYTDDVPPGVAVVVLDNAGAMQQAVEYLTRYGHRRIAHFTNQAERADFAARLKGYRRAMTQAGLSPHVVHRRDENQAEWESELVRLVEGEGVTAVTCANDLTALALWDLADRRGWRVPEDHSIIGMDNVPAGAERGLTTYRFSCEEAGSTAVHTLVKLMQDKAAKAADVTMPVELVERNSVSAPAPAR